RLGRIVVRGRDGILRAAPAARHAGEDLRVHDEDLRSGLRRSRGKLRRSHGAGGPPAPLYPSPCRRAVGGTPGREGPSAPGPTIPGRGYQARPVDLGAWRYLPFALIVGFFVVFGALPFVVLLLNSFMEVSGFLGWEMVTTRHWADALGRTAVLTSIKDTLLVSVAAATLGVVVSALVAYVVTRTTWAGRRLLDPVALPPWAAPGLVMSLGFLWAFVWLPIYGTPWLLVLVFVARGLPVGSRFFTATMVQVGAELEESARIHGGSWLRTFARIWVPLLRPAI